MICSFVLCSNFFNQVKELYRIIKYQIGASEIVKPETKAKSPVVALPQTVSNVAVEVCHSWLCTVSYVFPGQMPDLLQGGDRCGPQLRSLWGRWPWWPTAMWPLTVTSPSQPPASPWGPLPGMVENMLVQTASLTTCKPYEIYCKPKSDLGWPS